MIKKITLLVAFLVSTISNAQGTFPFTNADFTNGNSSWEETLYAPDPAPTTPTSSNFNTTIATDGEYIFTQATGGLGNAATSKLTPTESFTLNVATESDVTLTAIYDLNATTTFTDKVRVIANVTNNSDSTTNKYLIKCGDYAAEETKTIESAKKRTLVAGTYTVDITWEFGATPEGTVLKLDNFSLSTDVGTITTLSTANFEKFDFNFAPNPAKNFINLSAANSIEKVEVYNLLGKKALSTRINNDRSTLDISELASGIYVMQVTIDKQVGTYKIIKE